MSTSSHQSTKTTSGLLTFGHSYYITNNRGELISNAASFTNGGIEPAGNNGRTLSKLMVLLFMISNFVAGIATSNLKDNLVCVGAREVVEPLQHVTSDGQLWYTFDKEDYALDYVESLYLNGTSLRDAPLGTHFTQRRVADSEIRYTGWTKGECNFNKDNKEVKKEFIWQSSTNANLSHGFDFKLALKFASSMGVKIAKSDNRSRSSASNIGANDVVSIWTQAPMWYCEQQTQKYVRKYYGKHGCKCSAWSANIHGDIPAINKQVNLGFNSGTDAQCL
ncbi:hypothetical protein CANMA_000107 [Candida margitis]|uniref:uncharacterized protein n=1 Tax=Candida margitis TaxID=1775924 RepID=UPI0022265AF5|nr:uncharacterized protein CANMA_000107 [Candida margitis]KAI5970819.1 hypothetical protein CANMA_000107 [Candida margitis]